MSKSEIINQLATIRYSLSRVEGMASDANVGEEVENKLNEAWEALADAMSLLGTFDEE